MNAVHHWRLAAWVTTVFVMWLPACKRPADSIKDELGEAGFQLSAADWLRAAREDNAIVLKKFVAGGFAADTRDAAGDSALHAAAGAGAEKAADFLLNHGLAVDVRGGRERTPLMTAVLAKQPRMVRWLLRQDANPRLKDADGYTPLMLAVRENAAKTIGELAAHNREGLDAALLAAAIEGRAEVIDELTKYGASVYARMEDGRTPLMLAAQNNHADAVTMLLDLGCGRFATTPEGRTAAELATAEGHDQVAALILAKPVTPELSLEDPTTIAAVMTEFLDLAAAEEAAADPAMEETTTDPTAPDHLPAGGNPKHRPPAEPIQGKTLASRGTPGGHAPPSPNQPGDATGPPPTRAGSTGTAPIIMRHYRQREMPLEVRTVAADTATLRIAGNPSREVTVKTGETVPGSALVVVKAERRMASTKEHEDRLTEVSVVELKDPATGTTRELVAGLPASAHDPVALVEDARTGQRYTATTGQRFRDADGREYRITDVRPNQLIIEDAAAGTVETLPLRGPRG